VCASRLPVVFALRRIASIRASSTSSRPMWASRSALLERAVEWGRIPVNPARTIRKPPQRRERAVSPLSPTQIERIRAQLLDDSRLPDAVLVSVLAYAGLRPSEALALTWAHIRERTILVERRLVLGRLKTTKTARTRIVRLLGPLATDLRELRIARGRPADTALVFPDRNGHPRTDDAWRYWRRRIFAPAARAAGLTGPMRPYDLRHSFVSLLIAEGGNVVDIARQAGHSPTMTLSTYAHLFDELDADDRSSAEQQIRAARRRIQQERRTRFVPKTRPAPHTTTGNTLQIPGSRRPDSNRGPLHYE
jgi:integrase